MGTDGMSHDDGRYGALWWWSLAIGLAGGLFNCRQVGRGVFVIGAHENALSVLVAVVLFLTLPLLLAAARFPKVGGVALVSLTLLAMLGSIPFVEGDVEGLLLGWLRFFLPTLVAGAGFWLAGRGWSVLKKGAGVGSVDR